MRSKPGRLLLPLFAVLLQTAVHSVGAGTRPSFDLDSCIWHATHIIRVETTSADVAFTVMQTWKGDLNPGDALEVPALRPESTAVPITRYPKGPPFGQAEEYRLSERIPRQPIGSQMILFLKRSMQLGAPSEAATSQAASQ